MSITGYEDPLSADPLAEAPEDMATVARGLVLDDLAMERRRALQRMRGRGAEVISAPPGTAAVLLLRRYLALKRRLG